jgi:hypothetical protein
METLRRPCAVQFNRWPIGRRPAARKPIFARKNIGKPRALWWLRLGGEPGSESYKTPRKEHYFDSILSPVKPSLEELGPPSKYWAASRYWPPQNIAPP